MSKEFDQNTGFSSNERALIEEAVRRVQRSRRAGAADPAAVMDAVSSAVREGRRDLFGLVKAGASVAQ